MSAIFEVYARMILDSRGNPTVEVEVTTDDGVVGRAAICGEGGGDVERGAFAAGRDGGGHAGGTAEGGLASGFRRGGARGGAERRQHRRA